MRFFPTTATVGRWLASSTLDLPAGEVRIAAPTRRPVHRRLPPAASTRAGCAPTAPSPTWGGNVDGGDNYWGQAVAPDGRYTAVSAGGINSCGLRTDGTITCWGGNGYGQTTVPDGQYSAVSAAAATCGVRTDGTMTCWGLNALVDTVPDGRYTAVETDGNGHACGLRTDGTITCWGSDWQGRATAPAGRYTAVDVGHLYSCGLRTDGTITCWGDNYRGQANVPAGRYTAVSAGGGHVCALRTDGTITCWGDNTNGAASAPDGQYSRRRRRPGAFVRAAHRRHHHLLGMERIRAGDRARQLILRRHRPGKRSRPATGRLVAIRLRRRGDLVAQDLDGCRRPSGRSWRRRLGGLASRRRLRRIPSTLLVRHGAPRGIEIASAVSRSAIACRVAAPARISPTMWRASGAVLDGAAVPGAPRLARSHRLTGAGADQAPLVQSDRTPTGQRSTRRCRWTGRNPRPPPRSPNRGAVNAPPARPTPAGSG